MMYRLIHLWVVLLSMAVCVPAQAAGQFYGKLDDELWPDLIHIYQVLFKVVAESPMPTFVPPLPKGAVVAAGDLNDQRTTSGKYRMMLVEPPQAPPFLCADLDSNGRIDASERFPLVRAEGEADGLDTMLKLPIQNALFNRFPIFVRYLSGFKHAKVAATDRLLLQSVIAHALGTVSVNGKNVRFLYPFDPQRADISTTEGLFGIDVDGDGGIQNKQFSPETSYATNSEIVFRLADTYLSTSKIDLVKKEITVRKRAKEEYLRHELELGKPMPDFTFSDIDGKTHRLYDFRGKYLLVDFWGVWCIDCVRETPFHLEAYKRFQGRGFDVLALNTDENLDTLKAYLTKNKITWTQARKDSIRKLIEETYRIQEYPASILLGPDMKVLVLDQDDLKGERLLQTLDRILPK